ncbi:alpha-L-glutamate ligase [Aliidiomarina halalkaliphila]|uniref:Alpha-L-glutamate ligase n=1 Tax=Aliidiomarina halalkaliphila TaxID=2593535 RepID=A0A552X046_9GAMM|nr:alpha-L-glutamate ligase [Aliidiomarina halalkaliphila]TRW48441.1 alpha-L-glutamate ligase [Aliidiomarina halalkaliphila]
MRPIYVLHENQEWLVPLRAEFDARGVTLNEWFLDTGVVAFDQVPEDAVYYNRMSASSHTRGHRFAPELTRMALTWLEQHPVTVLNGTPALYLEVCKLSQYAALNKAGLTTPRTRAVVGREQLPEAARNFASWPLILKPNRGGKGLGVMRFNQLAELEQFVQGPSYEEPLDGLWLLQEYIQPKAPHITRCEFVGQKFVYSVDVNTEGGFELCPADVCAVGDDFCPTTPQQAAAPSKFKISQRFDGHPIIEQLETFLRQAKVDVAGIEVIENAQGELFVYDVNTNTNYNQAAEKAAGVQRTGMGSLADYLIACAQ